MKRPLQHTQPDRCVLPTGPEAWGELRRKCLRQSPKERRGWSDGRGWHVVLGQAEDQWETPLRRWVSGECSVVGGGCGWGWGTVRIGER